MRPTEELSNEHESIVEMLDVIEKVDRRLDSRQNVPPEHLREIVDFIVLFADKCHHNKEEGLLFVAMEDVGIPSEGGPVGVMLSEHTLGRRYVKEMKSAAEGYAEGDPAAGARFAESSRNYASLLRQHIEKEEKILYPMADMRLSPSDQKRLAQEFERVEREQIGPETHSSLLGSLRRLKAEYLNKAA